MNTQYFFLCIFLFVLSFSCAGQKQGKSVFFLDKQEIDINKYNINTRSIESLHIDSLKRVDLVSKKGQIAFINFSKLMKERLNDSKSKKAYIFMINNKLLKDTSGYYIDESYHIYVDTVKLSEAEYLKQEHKELSIVNVSLLLEPRDSIRLRGSKEFDYLNRN